MMFYPFYHK